MPSNITFTQFLQRFAPEQHSRINPKVIAFFETLDGAAMTDPAFNGYHHGLKGYAPSKNMCGAAKARYMQGFFVGSKVINWFV